MNETTTAIATTKPGWKSTEFYLTTITMLMGQLYASGVLGEAGTDTKIAALICSALSALGYTVMRTKAKA
jgi:hypothetical protein